MLYDTGIIKVIQIDDAQERAARIDCPEALIPSPGKYTLAHNLEEPDSATGQPLYAVGLPDLLDITEPPLLGPIPPSWVPGTRLHLRGPHGHGFHIPPSSHRIALAAFGNSSARLLPLIPDAIESGADVALFTLTPTQQSLSLPPAVEIHPLSALQESLSWANFLAIDITPDMLPDLRQVLQFGPHDRIPCQAQALIYMPMPCSALAECGACAVPTQKSGYKLACKDGPVFDLNQLDW
jgi:hypothetical protein